MSACSNVDQPSVAAAVIVRGGKVLLVKRRVAEGTLSWQFPAGAIEHGETPIQAAVRETREETGLTVAGPTILGERIHPTTGRTMIYVTFDSMDDQTHPTYDEIADLTWADIDALTEYIPHGVYQPVQSHLDVIRLITDS